MNYRADMREASDFQRSYEDFEPLCKWRRGVEQDVLEVSVPGFKKDELRILINNQGVLTISGKRQLEGNKCTRFHREFDVSKNCKLHDIHAKLSSGILYVTMKKLVPQNQSRDKESLAFNHKFGKTMVLNAGAVIAVVAAVAFGVYLMNICRRCYFVGN